MAKHVRSCARSYCGAKSVFDFKHRARHIDGYLQNIANETATRWKINQQQSAKICNLLSDLKSCTKKKDLQKGRGLHTNAVEAGVDSNIYVATALINMYAKCGSMEDARTVFDSIQEPNVVSWTTLILGYVDNGQGLVAFDLFSRMKDQGRCAPNSFTYVSALKACTLLATDGAEMGECLQKGREIHSKIGQHMDRFVQSTLINFYAKCGSMEDARTVFDSIQEPDVVSWNALILGYADNGNGLGALDLFSRMSGRFAPDSMTYVAALKACTLLATDGSDAGKRACLERGRQIHSDIGCQMDHFVQNTLINLYAKCGSMVDARKVFDSMKEPVLVSWNTLISGYAENAQGLVALDLFSKMSYESNYAPSSLTYVAALKACMSLAADGGEAEKRWCLQRGKEIHSDVGCRMDCLVQGTLINMYGKCGSMEDAKTVFDSIDKPNVVSWNCLILGYADAGQGAVALDLFSRMKMEGKCAPDSLTYLAALKACTSLAENGGDARKRDCLERGRQIHSNIGCHMDHFIHSTLIKMYAKCGSIEDARSVFDNIQDPDVVSWNCLILGYADTGQGVVALDLFSRMKIEGRCAPDSSTHVAALKACTSLVADRGGAGKKECLERGIKIHSDISGPMDHFVQSTLINLYAKCGSMETARIVFDSMNEPDVVSWNCLILGYADNGQGLVALDLFSMMEGQGRCAPNSITYLATLMACCSIGALATGRRIHSVIREFDSHLVTCLVDFYSRCGSMEEAFTVFNSNKGVKDVSTWNALLAGYARFGNTGSAFSLFETMQDQGFQPDSVTFVCMLSCCSHAGLLEKACEYIEVMPTRHGVTPSLVHYNCMIDILGRANRLDEAVALLHKMPCDPDVVTWTTLLGVCRKWKNVDIGSWAFKSLMDLDQKKAPAYVLMAEIYGSRGMWEEQERVLEASLALLN